jgi:hypothetical protein
MSHCLHPKGLGGGGVQRHDGKGRAYKEYVRDKKCIQNFDT